MDNSQKDLLISMLQVAVFGQYHQLGLPDTLSEFISSGETGRIALDLAHYGEYLFHAPKTKKEKGRSAKAFNNLARGVAILSAIPGGVKLFGYNWESGIPFPQKEIVSPQNFIDNHDCQEGT